MNYWTPILRGNQTARKLADDHYNRKSKGHREWLPGCAEYIALLGLDERSLWACCYQQFRRDGLDCFDNTYFRHIENGMKATDLILTALEITVDRAINHPKDGIITFVDPKSVKPTFIRGVPTWGKTYIDAGFKFFGVTGTGKLRFQFLPKEWVAC